MIKGKNFSCNNNKGLRKESDFYETPFSITQQLIENESFEYLTVLEPACGNGAIVKILNQYKYFVVGKDIQAGSNFLEEKKNYDYIITNPPFSLAKEFILKAKEIAVKKFAFLLPLSYLHGEERFNIIYTDKAFPLARVYVFTRYPMLGDELREDGKYRTGMMVYAWFVWEKESKSTYPEIRWISNQKYILNKKDSKEKTK